MEGKFYWAYLTSVTGRSGVVPKPEKKRQAYLVNVTEQMKKSKNVNEKWE